MGIVKVNRSGGNYNIYESNAYQAPQIGTLYNNEVFTWRGGDPANGTGGYYAWYIDFRSSSGEKKTGCIFCLETDPVFTNIVNVAKFTKVINGETYYGFKMRRNEQLYNRFGTELIQYAPKDRHILCKSSTSGESNTHYLQVFYLETGVGTGEYKEIIPGTYAFVDMGYDVGSMMNSNFSLIGSV